MSLDKFGRASGRRPSTSRQDFRPWFFPKTEDGNYDVENLKLCNVGAPTDPHDCVNKEYIDKLRKQRTKSTNALIKKLQNEIAEIKFEVDMKDSRRSADVQNLFDRHKSLQEDTLAYRKAADDAITSLTEAVEEDLRNLKSDLDAITQAHINGRFLEDSPLMSRVGQLEQDIASCKHSILQIHSTLNKHMSVLSAGDTSSNNE